MNEVEELTGAFLEKQFNKIYGENPERFYFSFHSCSICGYECAYYIHDKHLVYDSGCNCIIGRPSTLTPHKWDDIADLYNMQSHPESPIKKQIKKLFKLKEEANGEK